MQRLPRVFESTLLGARVTARSKSGSRHGRLRTCSLSLLPTASRRPPLDACMDVMLEQRLDRGLDRAALTCCRSSFELLSLPCYLILLMLSIAQGYTSSSVKKIGGMVVEGVPVLPTDYQQHCPEPWRIVVK